MCMSFEGFFPPVSPPPPQKKKFPQYSPALYIFSLIVCKSITFLTLKKVANELCDREFSVGS